MEAIIIWILIGACSGFIAKEKGRDPVAWTLLGALGGIFALIAIAVIPVKDRHEQTKN